MKFTKIIIGILIAALVIYIIAVLYSDSKACSEKGGELVRGIFWFKCIKAPSCK